MEQHTKVIITFFTLGALASIGVMHYLIYLGPITSVPVKVYQWIGIGSVAYVVFMTALGFCGLERKILITAEYSYKHSSTVRYLAGR